MVRLFSASFFFFEVKKTHIFFMTCSSLRMSGTTLVSRHRSPLRIGSGFRGAVERSLVKDEVDFGVGLWFPLLLTGQIRVTNRPANPSVWDLEEI